MTKAPPASGTEPATPDLDAPIAVSVRDVSMVFGSYAAVDRASFELPRGKFLTILGPSGSGKTTLLRMIAGFGSPTRGEIFINGRAVSAVPAHKRAIGMVFQKLALFPHMTAAENVAFPLKMRRHDARRIPERVERYLDLVRLGGYGSRRVHELSGGQQQRVAIARALVFEPDLLLLDEPLAALDRKLREEMQLEFRRIQRELGVTTINVTHDQREALVVSDEIIVMDSGVIHQMARPAETYRRPASRFVAGFIGVTNFVPQVGAMPGGALRAEQIRVSGDESLLGDLDAVVTGEVADAIFEGERVVYEVRVPQLGDAVLRVFDHDPVAHTQFEPGSRVRLGWNRHDIIPFSDPAREAGRDTRGE